MMYGGIGGDENLLDKIFFIFSDQSNTKMDFRLFLVGLEIFSDRKYEEKLERFIELADIEDKAYINKDQLYHIFRMICRTVDQKTKIKKFSKKKLLKKKVRDICFKIEIDSEGFFNKEEFFNVAL